MDDNRDPLRPYLTRILEEAKAAGAVAAEVLHERTSEARVEYAHGRRGALTRSEGLRIRCRVFVDGGGTATCEVASGEALPAALRKAVAKAGRARSNPFAGPADTYPITLRGLGIDDPRYPQLTDEDRGFVVDANHDALDKATLSRCGYRDVRMERGFASSRGTMAVVSSTTYALEMSVRGRDGRQLHREEIGRAFANVGALPYSTDLEKRLQALSGSAVALPEGDVAVILPPRSFAWVLAQLAPAFSIRRVESGDSFVPDVERIGSHKVHVTDDGSLHGAPRTRAFDDRGVAPMPVTIIREGVLGGYLHDPESARRHDARPTGHSVGDDLVPSNLVVRKGNRSRTQMLGEVPVAVFVDHLDGSLDLKTGQLEARGPALLLEHGKPRGVVPEVLLSGKVTDLLGGVVELSSDQERTGHVDCATTLIKGFPVRAG